MKRHEAWINKQMTVKTTRVDASKTIQNKQKNMNPTLCAKKNHEQKPLT